MPTLHADTAPHTAHHPAPALPGGPPGHEPLRECPDCGLFQRAPEPAPGQVLECGRCGAVLRRRLTTSLDQALAMALTSLALYVAAAVAPFLTFDLRGITRQTTLATLPEGFTPMGMPELTVLVLATTLLAPLLKLLATIYVLVRLRGGARHQSLAIVARWRARLAPWSMIEVFLLGVFVAYTRLAALAHVEVGPALYALGLLMLAMIATDALLDEDAMWDAIHPAKAEPPGPRGAPAIACDACGMVSRAAEGAPCPRCGAGLHHRRRSPVVRTWCLLAAGAVLYLPANLYPVMTVVRLGQGGPHTILGGAQELLEYGMWPLALLVFVASIMVPMMKLGGLGLLLLSVQRGWTGHLYDRTRLYRIVDVIGRWSMIDVFMVAVLVALVQMGAIASVVPGLGAVCFAGVVVLTMLAAGSFDPRLMWDAAERRTKRQSTRAAAP